MATLKEVEKQLKETKKELREQKAKVQFLLERLEIGHERNAELRKKIMTMTFDDVVKNQKELLLYQEKMTKDKELVETFENQVKQSEKLNAL